MAKRENSVYSGIAKDIEIKIRSGEYAKGMLLPPERVLKETYKVERTTIRRALEILAQKQLIVKKAGLGNLVGSAENSDVPKSDNHTVVTAKHKEKGGLVICIGSLSENPFMPVIKALESLCKSKGFTFSCVSPHDTATLKKQISSNDCKGVIITETLQSDVQKFFSNTKTPYIYAFNKGNGRSVCPDADGAMLSLMDILTEKGHKKAAYLGSDESVFSKAAEMSSLDYESSLAVRCSSDVQSGCDAFSTLYRRMSGRFTAVLTESLDAAKGVLKACEDLGVEVPRQLSVASLSYEKPIDVTCAVFNKDAFAQEILFALENEAESKYRTTCTTLVGYEIYGDSIGTAPGNRRNTMSDFLL